MPMEFGSSYNADLQRQKMIQKGEFVLVKVFRTVFALIKLLLTMIWGVVKGVLKTFGIPIG